jgi:hypothetical protein
MSNVETSFDPVSSFGQSEVVASKQWY